MTESMRGMHERGPNDKALHAGKDNYINIYRRSAKESAGARLTSLGVRPLWVTSGELGECLFGFDPHGESTLRLFFF